MWALCCGVWILCVFESSPVCGHCVVVCEDFEFFQSSPVCGPCAVVCEDFEFFKVPLCVKLCPCIVGDFAIRNLQRFLYQLFLRNLLFF